MSQLSVTIGGRTYRLACNPGEEEHLQALADALDAKIKEMRETFGEIGDQRLTVMAALTIADDAAEARATAHQAAERAKAAEAEALEARRAADLRIAALTHTLDDLTRRLDSLSTALSSKEEEV